jgi:hypothetical protein
MNKVDTHLASAARGGVGSWKQPEKRQIRRDLFARAGQRMRRGKEQLTTHLSAHVLDGQEGSHETSGGIDGSLSNGRSVERGFTPSASFPPPIYLAQ